MPVDYSLYLVTDSTPAILKDGHLPTIVRKAIEGGATIVQYRDKVSDTADLIKTAKEIHAVTKEHDIPFLINDRIDVALAVGAEGVHIGQDDIDLATARRLLGKDAIIGVTASSPKEAVQAAEGGADYLGLGTVFATPTKENTKSVAGPSGIRVMLAALASNPATASVKTVCIGGINSTNVQRVLFQTSSPSPAKQLDGVAVVSAIIAAPDPKAAAQQLRSLIGSPGPFAPFPKPQHPAAADLDIPASIPEIVRRLAERGPLCHNMTNMVVQNIAANVALCLGASPIMSSNGLEAADLARLAGSLVVNMGTVTPEMLRNYRMAVAAYNGVGGAVVLDPVGCGATASRKEALRGMMDAGVFAAVKGNEGEIKALAALTDPSSLRLVETTGKKEEEQQHGVDSGPSTLSLSQKASLAASLARTHKTLILITGAVDILSDGTRTLSVANGHAYLGAITGSGCCLGTSVAAYMAVGKDGDRLLAALAALLHYEIAAERAAARGDVRGPGTFVPAFLDELYAIREETKRGEEGWLGRAKVEVLDVEL